MGASYITRGILIGGSLGAFAAILGITTSLFISVGVGMLAGFFAGLTRSWLISRKGKR